MKHLIDIRGISKRYVVGGSEITALKNVSISVDPGEFVALIGSSGSGKSTLLHIMGFLDRPDSGEYIFSGSPVQNLGDNQLAAIRAGMVGFVFQSFHLLSRTTARDNVMLPMVYGGHIDRAHAENCLNRVGLGDRIKHKSNELSGGQRQRVAIARALANNPLVLFADEPTGNLDARSRGEVMQLFRELSAQGLTIVMVTHDPEVAAQAHRVVRMKDGEIVSDETSLPVSSVEARHLPLPKARWGFSLGELREQIKIAAVSILNNKMRSALTVLGMFIGVGAVIALMMISDGFMRSIINSTGEASATTMWVIPSSWRNPVNFTMSDVQAIRENCPSVASAKPGLSTSLKVVAGKKQASIRIEGADGLAPGSKNVGKNKIVAGRMFTSYEESRKERLAVLSAPAAQKLFEKADPIGRDIRINGTNYSVCGVYESSDLNKIFGGGQVIMVPFGTALKRLLGKDSFEYLESEAVSPEQVPQARREIIMALRRSHPPKSESGEDVINVETMTGQLKKFQNTFQKFSMVLYVIAGISLLVGGIGIMNIMLVSVTERTREIGLRKALGARSADILSQFLIESVVLCVFGGALGVAAGLGAAWAMFLVIKVPPALSAGTVLFAFAFSSAIGVSFGMWPASRAAGLDPVEALRYE